MVSYTDITFFPILLSNKVLLFFKITFRSRRKAQELSVSCAFLYSIPLPLSVCCNVVSRALLIILPPTSVTLQQLRGLFACSSLELLPLRSLIRFYLFALSKGSLVLRRRAHSAHRQSFKHFLQLL